MKLLKRSAIPVGLLLLVLLTTAFGHPRPNLALALLEGRTYDQTHDIGYIDWSGSVGYVYLRHRAIPLPTMDWQKAEKWGG